MKRTLLATVMVMILSAGVAQAAKLAPNANTLQPIAPDVQPAVSQSVQRTATEQDVQVIENVQAQEASSPDQQNAAQQAIDYMSSSTTPGSWVPWIILAIVLVLAAGAVWLWRSF